MFSQITAPLRKELWLDRLVNPHVDMRVPVDDRVGGELSCIFVYPPFEVDHAPAAVVGSGWFSSKYKVAYVADALASRGIPSLVIQSRVNGTRIAKEFVNSRPAENVMEMVVKGLVNVLPETEGSFEADNRAGRDVLKRVAYKFNVGINGKRMGVGYSCEGGLMATDSAFDSVVSVNAFKTYANRRTPQSWRMYLYARGDDVAPPQYHSEKLLTRTRGPAIGAEYTGHHTSLESEGVLLPRHYAAAREIANFADVSLRGKKPDILFKKRGPFRPTVKGITISTPPVVA